MRFKLEILSITDKGHLWPIDEGNVRTFEIAGNGVEVDAAIREMASKLSEIKSSVAAAGRVLVRVAVDGRAVFERWIPGDPESIAAAFATAGGFPDADQFNGNTVVETAPRPSGKAKIKVGR